MRIDNSQRVNSHFSKHTCIQSVVSDKTEHGLILNVHLITQTIW